MSKIFSGDINKIPSANFKKVKIMIGGQYREMQGSQLKNYVKDLVKGGKTLDNIKKHLVSDARVVGPQIKKREEIINLLGGGKLSYYEMKALEREKRNKIKANILTQKASSRLFEGNKSDEELNAGETKFLHSSVASALSGTSNKRVSVLKASTSRTPYSGYSGKGGSASRKGDAVRGLNTGSSAKGIGSSRRIGLSN